MDAIGINLIMDLKRRESDSICMLIWHFCQEHFVCYTQMIFLEQMEYGTGMGGHIQEWDNLE